jgi:hypothetical protein
MVIEGTDDRQNPKIPSVMDSLFRRIAPSGHTHPPVFSLFFTGGRNFLSSPRPPTRLPRPRENHPDLPPSSALPPFSHPIPRVSC